MVDVDSRRKSPSVVLHAQANRGFSSDSPSLMLSRTYSTETVTRPSRPESRLATIGKERSSMHGFPARTSGLLLLTAALLGANLHADPVPVRHPQGSAHGFVVLKSLESQRLATGDMTQCGDQVTSRLLFHFRDVSRLDS